MTLAEPPTKFLNSVHSQYPDNYEIKPIFLQADSKAYAAYGDRHVLIWWQNGTYTTSREDSAPIAQIVQLTGAPSNYHYYFPVVQRASGLISHERHQQFLLGNFTRTQRDQILALAASIPFLKHSRVNGCRVWTRDLLFAMVEAGLIDKQVFVSADEGIPLKARVVELADD